MRRRPLSPGACRQTVPCGIWPHGKQAGVFREPPIRQRLSLRLRTASVRGVAAIRARVSWLRFPGFAPAFAPYPATDAAEPTGKIPLKADSRPVRSMCFAIRNSDGHPVRSEPRTAKGRICPPSSPSATLLARFLFLFSCRRPVRITSIPRRRCRLGLCVPSWVERILRDHPLRDFTVPAFPRHRCRLGLFFPILVGTSAYASARIHPFRIEEKKPDTGRYRASLVRLVRLMRVGNPTFCITKVNSFLLNSK